MSGVRRWLSPDAAGWLKSVLRRGNHYTGPHASWEAARALSSGYDADEILARVREAISKVRAGSAVCERDGVVFDELQVSYPVATALLRAALKNAGRLSVIDFGGSLGSSYFQLRGLLDGVQRLRWTVVEQEQFVRCGQEQFQTDELRFHYSLGEAMREDPPDVILLSSVLQYLPAPFEVLAEVIDSGVPCVVIDRLVLSGLDTDLVAVQHVPASIYAASYPVRIFGRDSISRVVRDRYRVVAEFDANWDGSHVEYCNGVAFRSRGMILEKMHAR